MPLFLTPCDLKQRHLIPKVSIEEQYPPQPGELPAHIEPIYPMRVPETLLSESDRFALLIIDPIHKPNHWRQLPPGVQGEKLPPNEVHYAAAKFNHQQIKQGGNVKLWAVVVHGVNADGVKQRGWLPLAISHTWVPKSVYEMPSEYFLIPQGKKGSIFMRCERTNRRFNSQWWSVAVEHLDRKLAEPKPSARSLRQHRTTRKVVLF